MRDASDCWITKWPNIHDGQAADDHERDDCHHFNQGEPKLNLAIVFHIEQIDQNQGHGHHQHVNPNGNFRKPTVQHTACDIRLPAQEQ